MPEARTASRPVAEAAAVPQPALAAMLRSRAADYVELSKLRIASLVLVTVTAGFALSSRGQLDGSLLIRTLIGVTLAAAGSSALNQALERRTDARMRRTAGRPVPSGRVSMSEAVAFGLTASIFGPLFLAATVNLFTGALAALTGLLYVVVYTPLKSRTSLCTLIGAVPGALPPVLGCAAASGGLSFEALALFLVLLLWQFPHFLAIGWLCRDDYERAGLQMLPTACQAKGATGLLSVGYSLVLIPVSLLPERFGFAGAGYAAAAVVLGLGYVAAAVRFWRNESISAARGLLWASLVYLPLLLTMLMWDHYRLLQ